MKYIDLTLKRRDEENEGLKTCILSEAISKNNLIVLLGSPGSGKTSILKKYSNEYKDESELLTVKKLLKLNIEVNADKKVILLDGLDEYRSTSDSKSFVTTELGNYISKFTENATVVISCREMDWYGETDVTALKNEVNKEAAIYTIQALDREQQKELAVILEISQPETFISRFSVYGFLDNPQMFYMLSELYKNGIYEKISTKTELYLTFVKGSQEHNPSFIQNGINYLEPIEILKYAGYLAFFYMFTDIDYFDPPLINDICDTAAGYSKNKLEIVLNTKIFKEKNFVHRTIAEFALANFIKEQKLHSRSNPGISVSRVKNLFVKNGRIPTELRGTYAWLCSLTKNDELISADPYYQIIHGDNSLFDSELKKEVILEVKEYSQSVNPYFTTFNDTMQLEGFYTPEIDDFLKNEFEEALILKNHYVYFIVGILASAHNLSDPMKEFAKGIMLKPDIATYYKRDLFDLFKDEPEFLIRVLGDIKDNKIKDKDDFILDHLLRILYPKYINQDAIIPYLNMYHNSRVIGYCHYLFHTPYKDKYKLVDAIYQNAFSKDSKIKFDDNIKVFVEDYFLETLLEYDDSLNAQEIYDIIKYFKKFYSPGRALTYRSYRYKINEKEKSSEGKLQRLTNKLYKIYVDDILKDIDNAYHISWFNFFFGYKYPQNVSEVLMEKISSDNDLSINKFLFDTVLRHYPSDVATSPELHEISKKYHLEEDLYEFLNPLKKPWEIEEEKNQKEHEAEIKKATEDNEKYFAKRTDDEIINSFGDLHFICNLESLPEDDERVSLTNKTFYRLKKLLKKAIFSNSLIDPELLTLESLAKDSPKANRNIDYMYYTSCALNNWGKCIELKDNSFLKYLFINALTKENIAGLGEKSDMISKFISKDLEQAKKILMEYIKLLVEEYIADCKSIFINYLDKENDIDKLKYILNFFVSDGTDIKNELIYNLLSIYSFSISLEDLNSLEKTVSTNKNKQAIAAFKDIAENNKSNFDINKAIAIYSLLFEHLQKNKFADLNSDLRIKLTDYMLSQFHKDESLKSGCDFISPKQSCFEFLQEYVINNLTIEELQQLKEIRKFEADIWTNRIIHELNKKNQQETDILHESMDIKKSKNFILSGNITSREDFFADICAKLDSLKTEIEDNRSNDKDSFYSQDGTIKHEESCRDVILYRLNDKYGFDLLLTKEKNEANNRVDINIKYKANSDFEVQIECKRDDNCGIDTGISEQLIKKYFSSGVQYGIYLVFYFGKKGKNDLLRSIKKNIPHEHSNQIKVILIDLTR